MPQPTPGNELVIMEAPGAPAEAAPPNPLLLIHRALRGRYVVAGVCALVASIVGAVVGYTATSPLFESQGWVRAFPRQARVLYETEENQMLPMFEAFVRSQADLLRSRRTIDLALAEPLLREAGWPAPPQGVQRMIESLTVTAQRGSELISVTVSDPNPVLAQAAANAMLNAFMRYQEEQEGLTVTERERRLRENQQLLSSELKTLRESMVRIAEPFGGGDIEQLYMSRAEQLSRVESTLSDPAMNAVAAAPDDPADPAPRPERTLEELAKLDQTLGVLLNQLVQLDTDIQARSGRQGSKHPEMRALVQRRDALREQVERRADEVRARPDAVPMTVVGGSLKPTTASLRPEYEALRDRLASEVRDLAKARVELRDLQDKETETEKRLSETNKALEVIRVENEVIRGGRVRVQQRAATPLTPSKDRRLPLAAAGFLGGGGAVLGLFVLSSLLQRRIRFADDLQSAGSLMPFLGVIPEVRTGSEEEAASITLSLHHVRNSLLLLRPRDGSHGAVYAVTSANQGEGKTTVAIALAASFAQAGFRTALVDSDFVGRGLTREFGLDEAIGLEETIGRDTATENLHPTRVEGLRVIPTGKVRGDDAHHLTLRDIAPLIDRLRKSDEIIIIDTGPILGSLEAGLVAQLSDGVIMVAARGTSGRLVNAAIDRARNLCRKGVSVVFNRARADDLTTSASYSSVQSVRSMTKDQEPRQGTDRGRLVRIIESTAAAATTNGSAGHP